MTSLIPGYEYDIFISYRQKDNKYDGWVTEFVDNLKKELEATFKEEISVYFDINPSDYLLETYDVDASLKDKLKCLVFIPIISRTYCDPKSFAWVYEFKAFVEQASKDHYGLKIKLPNGNVASRILPIQIHDLKAEDKVLFEKELGGLIRAIEFIYKEAGVNRPLTPKDSEDKNINRNNYRNQINKVANAIDEIISSMKVEPDHNVKEKAQGKESFKDVRKEEKKVEMEKSTKTIKVRFLYSIAIVALLLIAGIIAYPRIFKRDKFKDIRDANGRISVAVMPFKNMTGDSLYNKWQDSFQNLIISNLSNTNELSVRSFETMLDVIGSTGHLDYASITPAVAKEIALKLESGTLILGNLSKAGEKIRINIQLKKAESSDVYKSFSLDCKKESDFFLIADSLSRFVKDFLRIEVIKQDMPEDYRLGINTTSPEAYINFMQATKLIFNDYDNKGAVEYLLKAVNIDSGFIEAYWFLGMNYRSLGNLKKAETAFNKADKNRDKLSFRDQQFLDHWKYGYLEKNPQKGVQILYQMVEKEPQNRMLLNNIGDLNRLMQNYDKEIEAYEEIIKLDDKWGVTGKWIWPYVESGDAYHIKGNHKKEAELYDRALKIRPGYPTIIFRQAKCALSLGDTARARGYISEYLSRNNFNKAQINSSLGGLYSGAGIIDKAEKYYRLAVNLDPKNQTLMNNLAMLLIKNNINIKEGIDLANKALESLPDNPYFQYTKGLGLLKQGNYTEALDLLEKSWDQRPGYDHDHFLAIEAAKKAVAGMK